MKDSTKVLIIVILALALLGGAYWLGYKSGSGDKKVVIREQKIPVPIEKIKIDTLPAIIKWFPKIETVVDSAEVLKLIGQRDSLAILLQRQNIDYVANLDTLYGDHRDTLNIQYSELYKRWNRIWIGFSPREVTVRDSLVFVPSPCVRRFYLGLGVHIGGGWGSGAGFGPQIGVGVQLGWIFM